MLAKNILTDDEKATDPQLGFPRGYAKLCRHAHIQMQGLITPFTEGPPQRFLPYAPLDEELAKLKEVDALFPVIDEAERDPSSARRYAGILWQQLDHLGNAGFDPTKFRVDAYGNVLYWDADPGSPLAWEVDHWFPHSRGGRTIPSNLRIVQWQVNQRKSTKLEFLVPWWDLQLGVSVNQFLSVFSSKNVNFRQRAFSLFFSNGENEQLDENLVVECHSWPQPFRERKHCVGLAPAAIVRVQRQMDDSLKVLNSNRALKQAANPQAGGAAPLARRRWTPNEEDALRRALQKFGPGNWKEIKEYEPLLVNRSTVQIKDKYRLMKGEWDKENREEPPSDCQIALLQREEQLTQARAEERKQKEEQLLQMEAQLQQLRDHNDKEKVILDELEQSLGKQRKRAEKQRKWAETQSQYRQCLEKMIRDTMHQCVLYKEQARLNQAACNALVARLESQKSACDSAEMDMIMKIKQRESLEALVRPKITKRTRKEGHTDVGGCIKLNAGMSADAKDGKTQGCSQNGKSAKDWRKYNIKHWQQKVVESPEQDSPVTDNRGRRRNSDVSSSDQHIDVNEPEMECLCADVPAPMSDHEEAAEVTSDEAEAIGLNDNEKAIVHHTKASIQDEVGYGQGRETVSKSVSPTQSSESAGMKRKASESNDLDVDRLRYEYGEASSSRRADRDDAEFATDGMPRSQGGKTRDDQQLDELLQEVLEMKGKVNAAMADAIEDEDDEERVKRMGKFNLDRWLQVLLLPGHDMKEGEPSARLEPEAEESDVKPQVKSNEEAEAGESIRGGGGGGLLGDFLKKISFKQQGLANIERLDATKEHHPKFVQVVSKKEMTKETVRAPPPSLQRPADLNLATTAASSKASDGLGKDSKTEERRVIESFSRLKLGGGECPKAVGTTAADSSAENSEVAYQIACETEFVMKMKAAREREQRRRSLANAGIRPQLQDLLQDSTSQELSLEQSQLETNQATGSTSSPSPSMDVRANAEQRRWSMGAKVQAPSAKKLPQLPSNISELHSKHQSLHIQALNTQQSVLQQQHPHASLQRQSVQTLNTQQRVSHLQPQPTNKVHNLQQNPQQPRRNLPHPIERSSSTPPAGAQLGPVCATSPALIRGEQTEDGNWKLRQPQQGREHTEEQRRQRQSSASRVQLGREQTEDEIWKQKQPSASRTPQLSRQLTAGHAAVGAGGGGVVVGAGGAARKASMLMKSASTRASVSSGESPARSSSSGGPAARRGGEGEPEVASIRRKASFFQDWDVNENLRASLSHVWKKAVKKFDLARQPQPAAPHPHPP